ncbi:MAG: amino acid adenylation domain-containing protein, partial [Pseudomonadota bacterium]|nr:amino acid adenylation domain-containing protein [Pseudomonadota bacterium]
MFLFELVQYIDQHGIDIKVSDDKLRIVADPTLLTEAVTESIRGFKPELIAYYRRQGDGGIVPNSVQDVFPLSFAQQRLYFLYQYDPTLTSFILSTELVLTGDLDGGAFCRAVEAVVARQPIYNSTYFIDAGIPRQRYADRAQFEVDVLDLSTLPHDQQELLLARTRLDISEKPFDLLRDTPLRVTLIKQGPAAHRVLVGIHHIVTDEWSVQLFVQEIAAAYRERRQERGAIPRLSYLDYSSWQVAHYEAGAYEVSRSFWKAHLDGIKGILELPLDRPRPAIQSYSGATVECSISAELSLAVSSFAKRNRLSEFTVYLGVYNLLLSKLSGDKDIVVGTDVYGRDHADLKDMHGFFVNQLALRSQVHPAMSVADYMGALGEATLSSLRYQDMPFDKVVEDLSIERDAAYSPLFQVKFLYERTSHGLDLFDAIEVREQPSFSTKSQYDLTLKVLAASAVFYYNTDLFNVRTIERWLELYLALLGEVIDSPHASISRLLQHTLAERLTKSTTGEAVHVASSDLFERIDASSAAQPDAIAMRSVDGALTYTQLSARIAAIASRLLALGVRKGDKVAVYLDRSCDMAAAVIAVMRAGAVFVPLDTSYPRDHIDYTLSDSGAAVVISSGALCDDLPEFYGFVLNVDAIPASIMAAERVAYPVLDDDDFAYLLYTSGSTGQPRGVLITHAAFANLCDWYIRFCEMNSSSKVLLMIPIGFDASIKNIFCPLMAGASLVLSRPDLFDPDTLLRQIAQERVSVINCAPSAIHALLKHDAAHGYRHLQSLELLALGGEALDLTLLTPWLQSEACVASVANIYGPTECTDISVVFKATKQEWLERTQVVIGRPIQNTQAFIVDSDMALCLPGVTGELVIAGRGVGGGYHNLPDATAKGFVDTGLSSAQVYRSGDICRYDDDGNVIYLGRRDGQIKIRGKRVETGEIIQQLSKLLPLRKISVQLYSVAGPEVLLAFVDGGAAALRAEDLKTVLAQQLPRHMVPAQILFVDAMPLTPNGKICGKSLLALFETRRKFDVAVDESLNDTEQLIASVWQRLLGVQGIEKQSDFFSLGGDSIFSIQLVSELRSLGIDVSVAHIFKYPSLELLAGFVAQNAPLACESPHIGRLPAFASVPDADRGLLEDGLEDAYPVTTLQHGMIFHGLLDEGGSAYHDVFSFELTLDFDQHSFVRALHTVVVEHSVLRTGFNLARFSIPLQLVYQEVTPNIVLADISMHDAQAQQALISEHIRSVKALGFDLRGPTLIRFSVLRKAEDCIQFIIDAHHAILDGWSMATLQRQIFEYYRQFKDGGESPKSFDASGARFADYVAQLIKDEGNNENRDYWDRYCRQSGVGAVQEVWPVRQCAELREIRLPSALALRVDELVARENVPIKTLMMMAHGYMLKTLMGSTRLVTGNADNGRLEERGAENVLGLFLNVLPYNLDLDDRSWREFGRALQQAEAERKPHRRYPFATFLRQHPGIEIDSLFTFTNFRVSQQLTRDDSLKIKIGELFEELNFKVSTHVSGNRDDGYSLLIRSKIHLSSDYMDILLRNFTLALERMVEDYDAAIPHCDRHWLPTFRVESESGPFDCGHVRYRGRFDSLILTEAAKELAYQTLAYQGVDSTRLAQIEPSFCATLRADGCDSDGACFDQALSTLDAAGALFNVVHFELDGWQHLLLKVAPELALGYRPALAGHLLNRYAALSGNTRDLWVKLGANAKWLGAERIDRELAYWRGHLKGAPTLLELPTDRPRTIARTHAMDRVELRVSACLTAGLRELSQRHGTTLFSSVCAGWLTLLARLSGQSDVVVGVTRAEGQPAPIEASKCVAECTLPLRVDLESNPTVGALLRQIQATLSGASAHAALPVAQLLHALQVAPMAGGEALFQVMLKLDDAGQDDSASLPHALGAVTDEISPGDLALSLSNHADGLSGHVTYATELFDRATAERFAACLLTVLNAMATDETQSVMSLHLLPPSERDQVLYGFNATATDAAHDQLIHELFEAQVLA